MEQVLIITSAHDLPAAEQLAARLGTYRTYFFDPTLVDAIAATSLQRAELLLWDDAPSFAELEAGAHAHVRRFEEALDRETAAARAALQPGPSLQGWQSLNLYYLMMNWQWYQGLWQSLEKRLRGPHPHIFVCDNPASFYWPSFVPALLLLQQLQAWDVTFTACPYGERTDESDVMMDLYGAADGAYDVLTHLPTCFYDAQHFSAELAAAGCRRIDVKAKYWNVPMSPDTQVQLTRLRHRRDDGRDDAAAAGHRAGRDSRAGAHRRRRSQAGGAGCAGRAIPDARDGRLTSDTLSTPSPAISPPGETTMQLPPHIPFENPDHDKTIWGYDTYDYNPVERHAFGGQQDGLFNEKWRKTHGSTSASTACSPLPTGQGLVLKR
jgi:hypothetical protein